MNRTFPIRNTFQHPSENFFIPYFESDIDTPCSVCLKQHTKKIFLISNCDHFVCNPCVLEYIKIRIGEKQVLTMPCPSHQCWFYIRESAIRVIVPPELYAKYIRFKKVEELNKNPFLKWCPKPDCEGYDIGLLQKSKLECNVCKYEYCFYCGEAWHRWKKCKFSRDKELDKWAKANGIKFCPSCKTKVEKVDGCQHMTCPFCNYEWCWLYGEKFDDGEHVCYFYAQVFNFEFSFFRIIVVTLGIFSLLFWVSLWLCTMFTW